MTIKPEMTCPTCGSHDISKNGTTRRGKQNYKCRDCGRQFVEDPQWKPKDKDMLGLINLLLLEKIPLAGIARATGASESWLQTYVNDCYASVTKAMNVLNGHFSWHELYTYLIQLTNRQSKIIHKPLSEIKNGLFRHQFYAQSWRFSHERLAQNLAYKPHFSLEQDLAECHCIRRKCVKAPAWFIFVLKHRRHSLA